MQASIRYYVLLVSEPACKLYEGIRDLLIEIASGGFPLFSSERRLTTGAPLRSSRQLNELFTAADRAFAEFYNQDPLPLVLVGDKRDVAAFTSITLHRKQILGQVEYDCTATTSQALGRIVWSLVKESIAQANEKALRELEAAIIHEQVVSGIDDVWKSINAGRGRSLLVEEGFHLKGSIRMAGHSSAISPELDVEDVFDNVVDAVIEKALELGGDVVFLKDGSLTGHDRIALILRNPQRAKANH